MCDDDGRLHIMFPVLAGDAVLDGLRLALAHHAVPRGYRFAGRAEHLRCLHSVDHGGHRVRQTLTSQSSQPTYHIQVREASC